MFSRKVLNSELLNISIISAQISPGSKASMVDLAPGDIILAIDGVSTSNMMHCEAQTRMKQATWQLNLTIQRPKIRLWSPRVREDDRVHPFKINLGAERQDYRPIGTGHNRQATPFVAAPNIDDKRQVVSSAYNSPIGLYSSGNIQDALHGQLRGLIHSKPESPRRLTSIEESDVYRMLQKEEGEKEPHEPRQSGSFKALQDYINNEGTIPLVTKAVQAPITKPLSPGGNLHKLPMCDKCGNGIVGMVVKVHDKYRHPGCFVCSDCEENLKQKGYFFIDDELYCETHAHAHAKPPESPDLSDFLNLESLQVPKMHNASPQKASGGDKKSQTISDLEKLMDRLQNTLVSLEEENLYSNKKIKAMQSQYYNLRAKSNKDKCGELDKVEKDQEVEEKKGEEFNMTEYKDVEKCSKSLDRTDSHLVQEDSILKHDHLEKQNMVVLLHEDLSPITKELSDDQKPFANSEDEMRFDTVVCLQKENRALRESLEQSYLVSMKVLRRVENLTEQQVELERCLFTLQTEKSLLQDEMRKLHQEYISLSKTVKLQLREGTTSFPTERDASGLIQKPGGSTHPSPLQRPATFGQQSDSGGADDLMTDDY
ncbi:hypothetical protein QTP70_031673 [Hemibagrus guttatus]|uniref:PDZ and LIM domain protein 3 n=1 Tax=Hemibagrus guttatus TaxID=175788 RepID=A0AAE0PTW1_9TELE|nr:hypothetical protein QTP70_031673 [Hemibagrus guttatus]